MIAGDPMLRKSTGIQRQICHRCFSTINQVPFGGAPCTGSDTTSLPTGFCQGGIRTTITFPTYVTYKPSGSETKAYLRVNSCWDGKNLDSADHKSHVAYPSSGTFESTGPCPASHPVRLPQLM